MVRSEVSRSAPDLRVVVATASGKASEIWGRARGFRIRRARRRRRELMWWKSWTSGVAALAAARRADNSTSAPDAATKPADAAAADAIDAVRAVADVSVQAIRRRRTDAVAEMNVLTNYCVAAFRDEPRVLPINSSS